MRGTRVISIGVPAIVLVLGATSWTINNFNSSTISSNDNNVLIEQREKETIILEPDIIPPVTEHEEDITIVNEPYVPAPEPEQPILPLPSLTATAYLVKNISTGRMLIEHDPNKLWPIASLTKIMTAIVAREALMPNSIITIPDNVATSSPLRGDFKTGESFYLYDLISAMMVGSNNPAADAIARYYPFIDFPKTMTEKARLLGMTRTAFYDPTGLSPLNVSTLHDIETMTLYAYYAHGELFSMSRAHEVIIRPINAHTIYSVQSTNVFVTRPDFIGGKTGFIDESKGNLITLFRSPYGDILVIVLGSDDRFKDAQMLYDWGIQKLSL